MRRAMRLSTAVLMTALLVLTSVPLSALGAELAENPPAGWTSAASVQVNGGCAGSNPPNGTIALIDGDENTNHGCTQAASNPRTFAYVRWTKTGGGDAPFTIESFRLTFGICTSGWPSYSSCGGGTSLTHLTLKCENTAGTQSDVVYDADISGQSKVTGDQTNLASPCTISTAGDRDTLKAYVSTSSSSGDAVWWSFEAYDDAVGPTEVDITEYIYNLRMSHPPFFRKIEWQWLVVYTGSWTVKDSDETVLASGTMPGNEFVGATETVLIQCPIICGEDSYTIRVDDTGNNLFAVYVVGGEDDGVLIPNSRPPRISVFHACYNATTNQCVGISATLWNAQSAGTLQTYDTWTGDPSDATIGHRDPLQPLPGMAGTPSVIAAQTEGSHRRTFTSIDTTLSPTMVLLLVNAADQRHFAAATVNYTTGGQVTTEIPEEDDDDDGSGIRTCAGLTTLSIELVACRLGQLLDVIGATFDASWEASITAVHDAAAEKLPFAYVVLAFDGIGEQLERAEAEVEDSDDCPGLVLSVPIQYGGSNLSPSPSPWPFTVLACEDLEATPLGSTWYQTVRGALDPALWLLFAWSQFKQLQPKPSLNG